MRGIPLRGIIRKVLRHEKVFKAELSIVFITDRKIKSLNKRYLNHNYETDVLSFDYSEMALPQSSSVKLKRQSKTGGASFLNGEIFVSTDTAVRNAKFYGTDGRSELVLYVIHGILHLLGYDDHSGRDIKRMRRKENELFKFVEYRKKRNISKSTRP